ncbi:MAG: ExeA family protein, partial [Pirellulaceae bacterium]
MYESFFHLKTRPFGAAPAVESYFPAESIEQARQSAVRVIERAEGPVLVIGPPGVGKSSLCRLLATYFESTFQVVLLSNSQLDTRKALLQSILYELRLPYRDMDEGELRLSLIDHLRPSDACPNGMLLIVDEAHTLPLRLLEEIRMITNLVRDGLPRVRLVLAGGPRLDERFASPRLESFNQRVAARCYLQSVHREESDNYVRRQINQACGIADNIFTEDAYRAVYQATDGIPRLINQVCNHTLTMACEAGSRTVDAARVEEAWADLQQLPTPWHEATVEADAGKAIIEFGDLDSHGAEPGDSEIPDTYSGAAVSGDADLATGAFETTELVVSDTPGATILEFDACGTDFEVEPEVAAEMEMAEAPEPEPEPEPQIEPVRTENPFDVVYDEEEVVVDSFAGMTHERSVIPLRVTAVDGNEDSVEDPQCERLDPEP